VPNSRWALRDFGFRAILATSFADIFAANCTNKRILRSFARRPPNHLAQEPLWPPFSIFGK
jgi:3-isopropylmalate dehydratase small subunit